MNVFERSELRLKLAQAKDRPWRVEPPELLVDRTGERFDTSIHSPDGVVTPGWSLVDHEDAVAMAAAVNALEPLLDDADRLEAESADRRKKLALAVVALREARSALAHIIPAAGGNVVRATSTIDRALAEIATTKETSSRAEPTISTDRDLEQDPEIERLARPLLRQLDAEYPYVVSSLSRLVTRLIREGVLAGLHELSPGRWPAPETLKGRNS